MLCFFQGNWKGSLLQEKVCELLSLHEKDYFGLRFIDTSGQTVSFPRTEKKPDFKKMNKTRQNRRTKPWKEANAGESFIVYCLSFKTFMKFYIFSFEVSEFHNITLTMMCWLYYNEVCLLVVVLLFRCLLLDCTLFLFHFQHWLEGNKSLSSQFKGIVQTSKMQWTIYDFTCCTVIMISAIHSQIHSRVKFLFHKWWHWQWQPL